jgi:hypothetical protein
MPKLYIKDYLPSAVSSKLSALTPFYNSRKSKKYLYTNSGVMLLRNNKIFRLNPVDVVVEDVGDGGDGCGGEYILDTSYMEEEEMLSQIPPKHVYSEVHELHFCVGKQSTIHFVVEGTYPRGVELGETAVLGTRTRVNARTSTSTSASVSTSTRPKKVSSTPPNHAYMNFVPHNLYFTTKDPKDNIDNKLLLREINMMLSIII